MREVRFKRKYKLPGVTIKKGETGFLWRIDERGTYWVALDLKHKGLRVLSNTVPVYDNSSFKTLEKERPDRFLELLTET